MRSIRLFFIYLRFFFLHILDIESALHCSEAEVHEETDSDGDVHQDALEVDPRFQLAVLLRHLRSLLKVEDGQVDD